jgi:hypothetical protein
MKALFLSLCLLAATVSAKEIKKPIGFEEKVYNATLALYADSEGWGLPTHREYLCTVTAFRKVTGGYLLIGAGHCEWGNSYFAEYFVTSEIDGELQPVTLLTRPENMLLDVDYAVYFYPTKLTIPVIPLGNEADEHIGSKTISVSFPLAATKILARAEIVSNIITTEKMIQAGPDKYKVNGFFLVNEIGNHGSSGSTIVSVDSHKIIGLLISAMDGVTSMPLFIQPITPIIEKLSKLSNLPSEAKF